MANSISPVDGSLTDEQQRVVMASRMGLIEFKPIDLGKGKCEVNFYIGDDNVTQTFISLISEGIDVVSKPNVTIIISG